MTIGSFLRKPDAVEVFKGKVVDRIEVRAIAGFGVEHLCIIFADGSWVRCATPADYRGTRGAVALFENGVHGPARQGT